MGTGNSKATMAHTRSSPYGQSPHNGVGRFSLTSKQTFNLKVLSELLLNIIKENNLFDLSSVLSNSAECSSLFIMLSSKLKQEFSSLRFPEPGKRELQTVSFIPKKAYETIAATDTERKSNCAAIVFFLVRFVTLIAASVSSVAINEQILNLLKQTEYDRVYAPTVDKRFRNIDFSRESVRPGFMSIPPQIMNLIRYKYQVDKRQIYIIGNDSSVVLDVARGIVYYGQKEATPVLGITIIEGGTSAARNTTRVNRRNVGYGMPMYGQVPYAQPVQYVQPYAQPVQYVQPYAQPVAYPSIHIHQGYGQPSDAQRPPTPNAPRPALPALMNAARPPTPPTNTARPAFPALMNAARPPTPPTNTARPTFPALMNAARPSTPPTNTARPPFPALMNAARPPTPPTNTARPAFPALMGASTLPMITASSATLPATAARPPLMNGHPNTQFIQQNNVNIYKKQRASFQPVPYSGATAATAAGGKTRRNRQRGGSASMLFKVSLRKLLDCTTEATCNVVTFFMDENGNTYDEYPRAGAFNVPFATRIIAALEMTGMRKIPTAEEVAGNKSVDFTPISKVKSDTYKTFQSTVDRIVGNKGTSISPELEGTSPAFYRGFVLASDVSAAGINTLLCKDIWANKRLTDIVSYSLLQSLYYDLEDGKMSGKAMSECTEMVAKFVSARFVIPVRDVASVTPTGFEAVEFPPLPPKGLSEFCSKGSQAHLKEVASVSQQKILKAAYDEIHTMYNSHLEAIIKLLQLTFHLDDIGYKQDPRIILNDVFVMHPQGAQVALEEIITKGRKLIAEHYFNVERVYRTAMKQLATPA